VRISLITSGGKMKKFLVIFSGSVLGLIVLAEIFLPSSPELKYQVITMQDYYLCEYTGSEWVKKDVFTTKENINVCFSLYSTVKQETYLITYHVYQKDNSGEFQEIYFDQARVPETDCRLQLDFEKMPGEYLVKIYSIRQYLFEIPLMIEE
jgi:hypothetical protein